jgi:peptide chain release factor 1
MLEDPDESLRLLAAEDDQTFTDTLGDLVEKVFPSLIIPPSKTAHMSALMELKAGVGGSESSLFLGELMRMYLRFAQSVKWKTTTVSSLDTPEGGVKNAVVEFKGPGAYDSLRWESGVHRVQRVPATEASGRVHTSTVAVVVSRLTLLPFYRLIHRDNKVLPLTEESDHANQELFSMADVKVEVMRARGAGGQVGSFHPVRHLLPIV